MIDDYGPFEDKIAGASEELVLRYNPAWSGAGETMHPIWIPDCYSEKFELVYHEEYPLEVPFTRESWNGRMKACRGIGASLTGTEIAAWEQEHRELLAEIPKDTRDEHRLPSFLVSPSAAAALHRAAAPGTGCSARRGNLHHGAGRGGL